MNGSREVIVLGATGYVGGRLVSKLLEAGNKVRVLTRSTGRAERYEWSTVYRCSPVTCSARHPRTGPQGL